jgi:hypothetical protein
LQQGKSSRTDDRQAIAEFESFATALLNCIFCSDATRGPIPQPGWHSGK